MGSTLARPIEEHATDKIADSSALLLSGKLDLVQQLIIQPYRYLLAAPHRRGHRIEPRSIVLSDETTIETNSPQRTAWGIAGYPAAPNSAPGGLPTGCADGRPVEGPLRIAQ
jgi:hypothetical protein